VNLLVTGRDEPGPALARAVVQGQLARLEARELAFAPEEAAAMAHDLGLDAEQVVSACRRVGGWAAGLRLLCDLDRRSVIAPDNPPPRLLFDYLAGLVHRGQDEPTRRLLRTAALLPWIQADVLAALANDANVRPALDRLCERHLFIEPVDW
jgi:LuxR family maltose regulon positive regulatory protein